MATTTHRYQGRIRAGSGAASNLTPARYPKQLDLEAGLDHKERGQAKVAESTDAQAWLARVRAYLADLASQRSYRPRLCLATLLGQAYLADLASQRSYLHGGTVTVDDAHREFETPAGVHPSIWGAIFHGGGYTWRRVGYGTSSWEPSHGAIISIWELTGRPS